MTEHDPNIVAKEEDELVALSPAWMGDDTMHPPAAGEDRKGLVWIDSGKLAVMSQTDDQVSNEAYLQLLRALEADEELSLVHEQDNFTVEWNAVVVPSAATDSASATPRWGRIRRYEKHMLSTDEKMSVVYEDAIATRLSAPSESQAVTYPYISCLALQQSQHAARQGAWVRIVGVIKYRGLAMAMIQEYDGTGMMVFFRGGAELRPLFLLEVVMAFSDALWRESHDMWMSARYKFFSHRWANWKVPVIEDVGPKAASLYEKIRQTWNRMGYPEVGISLVDQLERVNAGFEEETKLSAETKLVLDAKLAAGLKE